MLTYESLLEAARQKFLKTESINGNLDPTTPPETVAYSLGHAADDTVDEIVLTLSDALELINNLHRLGIKPYAEIGEFSDDSWLKFLKDVLQETLHHQLKGQFNLNAIDRARSTKFSA